MRSHSFPPLLVLALFGACARRQVPSPDTVATSSARGSQPLVVPMVFPRMCEGEDCEVEFPALACTAVVLRSTAADAAPVAARIAKGDTVEVRTVDLHVTQPGRVVLRRDFALDWVDDGERRHPATDTLRFAAGDTVYLLHYESLGGWTWWHRGRVESGNEFWAGPADEELGGVTHQRDSSVAVGLSHPRRESWWRVELRSGASGWWHADTTNSLLSIPWMQRWNEQCSTRM